LLVNYTVTTTTTVGKCLAGSETESFCESEVSTPCATRNTSLKGWSKEWYSTSDSFWLFCLVKVPSSPEKDESGLKGFRGAKEYAKES
jgi:hypothetical protein